MFLLPLFERVENVDRAKLALSLYPSRLAADADWFIKKKGRVLAFLSCGESCQLFVASRRVPPRSDVVTGRRHSQLDRSLEERSDTTPTAPSSAPARETSTPHIIRAESSGRALSYSCTR